MSIEVKNINKRFGDFVALDNVSLEFPTGELVALLGPSGCGKTAVGKVLAKRIDAVFLDADDYHTPENIERMRSGEGLTDELRKEIVPLHRYNTTAIRKALRTLRFEPSSTRDSLARWLEKNTEINHDRFSSHLYSQSPDSPLKVAHVAAEYREDASFFDGREISG